MGPGLNAVCAGREEQYYKSAEGGEEVKPRRGGGDKKGGVILSYQIRLAQRRQESEVFPAVLTVGPS